MTHLDLFSGIGGFAIAAQACGYTTVGFCEREPYAQQILKERFCAESERIYPNTNGGNGSAEPWKQQKELAAQHRGIRPRLHDDIFTLNGADYAGVDLLTGGFPCQPFSVAGKRLGKADDRAIWPEMLRVIREAKPAWIIGENVAGIVTMELDNILSDLEALGYSAWPLVIPACAVDARHRRDRVWIIARRNVEDSAGERSRGESGNALHEGRGASEAGGTGIPQATGRQNGSAIGDDWTTGQDVAHADSPRVQGQRGKLAAFGEARQGRQSAAPNSNAGDQRGEACRWLPEPELGRVAHGIPEGLDSGGGFCQWPEEDHETPRVTTGMKHRAHRLKGLGNAIVVQVATEIIRAITSLE